MTEEFKEKHSHNKEFKSGKSNAQEFFEQFNTEARFNKAIQKLKESGEYQGEPKEIGKLMKILNEDLEEECKEDVKEFFEQFNTEARFNKAIQKLKESGEYQGEPKEIGKLMKILNEDLEEECKEDVKDATKGFPEWYKRQLLDKA